MVLPLFWKGVQSIRKQFSFLSFSPLKTGTPKGVTGKQCRPRSDAAEWSGHPLDAPDKQMCEKVRDLVYSDRRIQVEEIAQALGNSYGSVSTILHDRLGMLKLTARWVPKSLSDEQMATRASVCSALLKRFRSKDDFLLRLVTVDKTGIIILSQRIKLRFVSG